MKNTGILRRIDELGRVVIPIEIREKFNIKEKDPLEIYVDNQFIMLKKHEDTCVFCGKVENLQSFKNKMICNKCLNDIKNK